MPRSERGVKGVEAAIEPERELVEVGLQVLGADAVMDAVQPRLQVREDEMADRQELLSHLGIAAFSNRVVVVAPLPQTGIAAPVVGDDQRPRHDGTLDESDQRPGAAVVSNGQPDATGIATILPLDAVPGSR